MARDILAVPVADVGVERMFNMARDIYHYWRSNLKVESIRGSMMLKVFDKIELNSKFNDIEDGENLFLIGKDESDEEEYDMILDYISDYEEQEEPANAGTQKKMYSIGRTIRTHLRDLYDNHCSDRIDKQVENGGGE